MQRGATLPLPSRWLSTKGCGNTCGQPHWAPVREFVNSLSTSNVGNRIAIGIWKRPHAPGTHATRRNIAVAIPWAFNKRLQQHMRSTTLGLDVRWCLPQAIRVTSESRLAFGKCAPNLLFAPDLHKGHHSPLLLLLLVKGLSFLCARVWPRRRRRRPRHGVNNTQTQWNH